METGRTFSELERWALSNLEKTGLQTSPNEVQLLLMQAAELDKVGLISRSSEICPLSAETVFRGFVDRRSMREPVYRILGRREFHGLIFELNEATLEPRDDTECLVETALELIGDRNKSPRFLDLGTGTGAIALALLMELPGAEAVATDLEPQALEMATSNAALNGLAERFCTVQSNWFESVCGKFDFIVSNPPYIASTAIGNLQEEVQKFDPVPALDGGVDGLDAYRAILDNAARYLKEGGFVGLEIGFDQKHAVSKIAQASGWVPIRFGTDMAGLDRALFFQ